MFSCGTVRRLLLFLPGRVRKIALSAFIDLYSLIYFCIFALRCTYLRHDCALLNSLSLFTIKSTISLIIPDPEWPICCVKSLYLSGLFWGQLTRTLSGLDSTYCTFIY